jgi:hypothetical protein
LVFKIFNSNVLSTDKLSKSVLLTVKFHLKRQYITVITYMSYKHTLYQLFYQIKFKQLWWSTNSLISTLLKNRQSKVDIICLHIWRIFIISYDLETKSVFYDFKPLWYIFNNGIHMTVIRVIYSRHIYTISSSCILWYRCLW